MDRARFGTLSRGIIEDMTTTIGNSTQLRIAGSSRRGICPAIVSLATLRVEKRALLPKVPAECECDEDEMK